MKNLLIIALFSIFLIGCGSEPEPMKKPEMDKDKIEKSFKELDNSK